MRCALRSSHRALALCNCSFLHSLAVVIPTEWGFRSVNFSTFLGIFGCWLGWSVESETTEPLFKGVGDGVVRKVDKSTEMSSSRGSIPLWCEDCISILEDLGEVVDVVEVVVIVR